MDQASWNLCPRSTAFSGDCYYAADQQFSTIAGEVHEVIDDAPDGSWDLAVKRDIFAKVGRWGRGVGVVWVWCVVGVWCGMVWCVVWCVVWGWVGVWWSDASGCVVLLWWG
jgi:hypothetical protein